MSSTVWTFGPGGEYTATWDGAETVTVTLTSGGAFTGSVAPVTTLAVAQAAAAGLIPAMLALPIAGGGTGKTTAAAAFNALNPNAAPVRYGPANPAGTVSTTQVMMGLGSACVYTPASSGLVLVSAYTTFFTLVAASSVFLTGQYGTGAAPANGAAVTGTQFGGSAVPEYGGGSTAANARNVTLTDLLTLTPGEEYWFDFAVATNTAADEAELQGVVMVLAELPAG